MGLQSWKNTVSKSLLLFQRKLKDERKREKERRKETKQPKQPKKGSKRP